jgi:hypothetical protein
MINTKKCGIHISQDNPTKLCCFTCDDIFNMPMTTDVLKAVCAAYKEMCEEK